MISDGYISNFTAIVHIGNFSSIHTEESTCIAGRDHAPSERNNVLTESTRQCVLDTLSVFYLNSMDIQIRLQC